MGRETKEAVEDAVGDTTGEILDDFDEYEQFYEDLFEQQRETCREYEDFLDDLRELQREGMGEGLDIPLGEKGKVPLQYLINLKYSDEELEVLYELWFTQKNVLVNHKNAWGKSPLELAEKMPFRASVVERMKKYE